MIKIYLCGPTVYDDIHIGNTRPMFIVDLFIRSLISQNKKYLFVENITDIDDKIINRAIEENKSEQEIYKHYTNQFLSIVSKLNLISPHHLPKVTENISGMIIFIEKLLTNNNAYILDKNVIFDTTTYQDYGSVSKFDLNKLEFQDLEIKKRNQADFVLWKSTSKGVTWDSPWGKGRPGWHTECAYFVDYFFNQKQLDFHCGGVDLKFPHNENENAQFAVLNKVNMAKNWKSFGHLNFNNTKMSKSLRNVIYAKEFLVNQNQDVLRYMFLTTSPFAPLSISDKIIKNKVNELKKIEILFKDVNRLLTIQNKTNTFHVNLEILKAIEKFDFASANKITFELIKKFNLTQDLEIGLEIANTISKLGFSFNVEKWDKKTLLLFNKWKELIDNKIYVEADKIRDDLKKTKIVF